MNALDLTFAADASNQRLTEEIGDINPEQTNEIVLQDSNNNIFSHQI
jgi:hypothetical protein